jgi:hypothetical protein
MERRTLCELPIRKLTRNWSKREGRKTLKSNVTRHWWLTPVIPATQEDRGSKPAQANSSPDPILEKTHHEKRPGGVAQSEGPEFKPQCCQKKKNCYLILPKLDY